MNTNFAKDKHFLHRLNAGDEQAFLKVYDIFAPKIFRYIYYKVGRDKELSEELAQMTFVKAWEYIVSEGRPIENAQALMYRIAHNLIIDRWRAKDKESLPLMDELIETTRDSPRWQEEIEANINVELLESALSKIPEQYREIIMMRYMDDLDIEEISQVLGKDKNNIYVLIHRALKAIRRAIENNK